MSTSVVKKIEEVQGKITKCENRLDFLERRMRLFDLPQEERNALAEEEKTLREDLARYQQEMRSSRVDNFKSMLVSVIILVAIVTVYSMFAPQ